MTQWNISQTITVEIKTLDVYQFIADILQRAINEELLDFAASRLMSSDYILATDTKISRLIDGQLINHTSISKGKQLT